MSDLKERLRTMADMINLCEKISWGMDSAIMHEAAVRIEELEAELATARNDALEEAADVCWEYNCSWKDSAWHCRQAIRALKCIK